METVVCHELERRAACCAGVADSDALTEALAELDAAREDLEEMRRDVSARRRLGGLWLSFVKPLVEAVHEADRRVADLRASQFVQSSLGSLRRRTGRYSASSAPRCYGR